jgi:menaquinone-dependent protoporphyrinogen oxidase
MNTKVLVAYGTKYGATAEIAEKIGEVLRQAGFDTDVTPANQVKDLVPYQAVVLGSAVYMGQWRRESARFMKANEKALAERLVWIFSSGPVEEGDPEELVEGWGFPKGLQPFADRIQPQDNVIFHGMIDPDKLTSFHKWVLENVKSPVGDFRDWDAITAWATSIADALKSPR